MQGRFHGQLHQLGLKVDYWLDAVLPRTCIECGCLLGYEEGGQLCPHCRSQIQIIQAPYCTLCGYPLPGCHGSSIICRPCKARPLKLEAARALFLHRGVGLRLVHRLKYLGGEYLRRELILQIKRRPDVMAFAQDKVLVPVPLARWRSLQRGYNQAEVIARSLQDAMGGGPLVPALVRTRSTRTQTQLSRRERQANVSGAFRCIHGPPQKGRPVLLIDDVQTTGATLESCAEAMRSSGWGAISAFTLAHG
jgi:ComF family protein